MTRTAPIRRVRWLVLLTGVVLMSASSVALWPRPATAAEGNGGGTGVTVMDNLLGAFCTQALMDYTSDFNYQGTYTDPDGGTYSGRLEVRLQPGAGARVSQNPFGTLRPDCTGQPGYKYPITGTVKSLSGEVSCTFGGPESKYWRVGERPDEEAKIAYADLYGSCSVKGYEWPTYQRHVIETRQVNGTPPTRATSYSTFQARDIGQRPPGAPPPAPIRTTTTTSTTIPPPPPAARQETPPPATLREPAGPSDPAQASQDPVRGGGLAQPQPPPAQQAPPSQVAQQIQAQQASQVQAQPAMMLEHQRQLQVEKATIQRRSGRPQRGYLASARRSREPAPAAAAAVTWGAGLGAFGVALCYRRKIERRWVGLLAPARLSSRTARQPQRPGGRRW